MGWQRVGKAILIELNSNLKNISKCPTFVLHREGEENIYACEKVVAKDLSTS